MISRNETFYIWLQNFRPKYFMEDNNIIDWFEKSDRPSVWWKHLFFFGLIIITILSIMYWIGCSFGHNTKEMKYLSYVVCLEEIIVSGVMIGTYKTHTRLGFQEKVFFIVGLITIGFIWWIGLNYFNIFDRKMSSYDFDQGVNKTIVASIYTFVLSIIVCAFIKSKEIKE